MNDMRPVTIAKSDQLNSDDLIAGPITITIREVTIRPGTEQPVSIHFEGDNDKPYKPCKSMSRVLVAAWGPDATRYIGRSVTLYCDPKVKWGGMEVGGIRISHLSHIEHEMLMALTATKGKRAPFIVKPMEKSAKATRAAAFSEEVIDGDGERHTCDSPKAYLEKLRWAISAGQSASGVWESNVEAFSAIQDRAEKAGASKVAAAFITARDEINASLA